MYVRRNKIKLLSIKNIRGYIVQHAQACT